MKKAAYRLAEYQITESEHGDLWWETHIGLGSLKNGKCFINGDILFLKSSDAIEPGFLKNEFLDHLKKLPIWGKTKYYCTRYEIRPCKSNSRKAFRRGLEKGLQNTTFTKEDKPVLKMTADVAPKPLKELIRNPLSYKLGHYEITENNKGRLSWKSYRGPTVSKTGRCYINENILFLEPPGALLSSPGKKGTVQKSARLPNWEKTDYCCRIYAIYYSRTGAICRKLSGDKDLEGHTANTDTSEKNGDNVGKKIESIVCSKTPMKNRLATVLSLCSVTVCLVVKLLLNFFQLTLKISKALIAKGRRIRG